MLAFFKCDGKFDEKLKLFEVIVNKVGGNI